MTILDLQARMREVGRIRLGERDGNRPVKLDVFRLTSRDSALLEAAAARYGGEVVPWPEAPGGPSWQVKTEATELPCVLIPRILRLSQHRELWSGGGCLRRCNGEWDSLSDGPCICAAEDNLVCQTTTRLSLLLHELPVSGCWRVESHGYYAAAELKGSLGFIEGLARDEEFVPVVLRLDPREVRRPGDPVRRFNVPVLVDPDNRLGALLAGAVGRALPPAPTPQLAPAQQPPEEGADAEVLDLRARLLAPVEATATVNRAPMPHRAPAPRTRDGLTGAPVQATLTTSSDPTPEREAEARERSIARHPATPSTRVGADGKASRAQVTKLQAMYHGIGISSHEDRVSLASALFERDVLNTTDLSFVEASTLIDVVTRVSKGELDLVVDDEGHPTGIKDRA